MSLLDRLGAFVVDRPWTVLLTTLATIPLALWLASGLEVEEDFGALLDDDHPAVRDLREVAERTGGTAFLIVAIEARHPASERFADTLASRFEALDDVLAVEGRASLAALTDRRLLLLSPERLAEIVERAEEIVDERIAATTGLFVDLTDDRETIESLSPDLELPSAELRGADGRYLYLYVRLRGESGDIALGKRAETEVREQVEALRATDAAFAEIGTALGGSVIVRAEEHRVMQADLRRASIFGFVGVVLLIAIATRRLSTLLLVPIPLLVGVLWTFAIAEVIWGRLNILTGFLATILFGLGIDFLLHMFVGALEVDNDRNTATRVAVRRTGRAIVTGAVTTIAAFGAVAFADFDGYRELGVLAACGVAAMVVVALTAFPALHLLFDRAFGRKRARTSTAEVPAWTSRVVLVAVPALFLFSVFALLTGQVRFETNWRSLKGESPASDFDDYVVESLGRSLTLTLVEMDPASASRFVEIVDAHVAARKAAGLPTGITRAISIAELVPADQGARRVQIEALRKQLERIPAGALMGDERAIYSELLALTKVQPYSIDDLPASVTRRFFTQDREATIAYLFTDYVFYEIDQILDWSDEMDALSARFAAEGVDARIMSENWVAGSVFRVILHDGPKILLLAMVFVFVALWLDFGRLGHAAAVFGALVIGLVSMTGVMRLIGLELNFFNAVIVPCIVGIGIDGAIHVYHRYLDGTPIAQIVRHTSYATGIAAATTIVGFGAMALAHHRGIRTLGMLAIVGVATTYVSTSLFFPFALERWGRRRPA